jgi:hypothetical protein
MTSDGVDGTAAECQPGTGRWTQVPCRVFIKRDDGRLAPRYMGAAYLHTPAGAAPNSLRCERQVASALRSNPDFVTASLICGADGIAGRACAGLRLRVRPAAVGAKGSR